jgi:predicted enzyme related to lactoylglutathione lyase
VGAWAQVSGGVQAASAHRSSITTIRCLFGRAPGSIHGTRSESTGISTCRYRWDDMEWSPMDDTPPRKNVLQLRLVVEAEDFEEAVAFYRDALGMEEEFFIESEGDALVMALKAGRATLEIVNPAQRRLIDHLEVGTEVSRSIRVGFEVADTASTTERLVGAGAALLAVPTETPWRSLNSRLEAPAGLQITLFEELEDAED